MIHDAGRKCGDVGGAVVVVGNVISTYTIGWVKIPLSGLVQVFIEIAAFGLR